MATIEQLLATLGVEDSAQEKTASAASKAYSDKEIEKATLELGLISKADEGTTKIASQTNGGTHMNLHDLYSMEFEGTEKIASFNQGGMDKQAAADMYAGEAAGRVFARELESRLTKVAMEMVMDSEATQDRQEGPGVVPSGHMANPQLEVNRPVDGDEAIDTDPQYYSLLDQAVQKKALEKALEEGMPGALSHKTIQVDSDIDEINSQMDA